MSLADLKNQVRDRTANGQASTVQPRSNSDDIRRLLPQAPDAEKGVLCAMLLAPNECIPKVRSLDAETFHVPANRSLFAAIRELYVETSGVDFVTLARHLEMRGQLESVGGTPAVSALFTDPHLPTTALFDEHLAIVVDAAQRRAVIAAATKASAAAWENTATAPTLAIVGELESTLGKIRRSSVALSLPEAVPLMDLADTSPDPTKTLLGDRFLCIGGGMLFVGPSGIGKSSASVQQDILWALGREAFGIRPARPLRVLCIQAENDDGDLGEMARGVCAGQHLSNKELRSIRHCVLYVSERSRTGPAFLNGVVAPLLARHRPDILRIDPKMAYIGGDVSDPVVTAAFLRTGLNPLLEEFQCAVIINHHTPKVTNRDTTNWRGSDWMYAGAGSADITNWCRAAMVIDPTHSPRVFRFIAAKRGRRLGWRDEHGESIIERLFCHAAEEGAIYWCDATAEDAAECKARNPGRKAVSRTPEDLKALVPSAGAIPKTVLFSTAQTAGISDKRARGLLAELLDAGELHEWRIPRPRTNPQIRISRHEQTIV